MNVYRIAQKTFIQDLSGEGARLFGGRWNHRGVPLLYTAESRSLATFEILVHAQKISTVSNLAILTLEIPNKIKIDDIKELTTLPLNWQKYTSHPELQDFVSNWINSGGFILKVPSAIINEESNYLINPLHKNMKELKVIGTEDFILQPIHSPIFFVQGWRGGHGPLSGRRDGRHDRKPCHAFHIFLHHTDTSRNGSRATRSCPRPSSGRPPHRCPTP